MANVTGELYPMGPDVVPEMLDLLASQVASPVQFVKGLRTLYSEGARVFVEVGPKKALQGFAADVLGDDVVALATNHPKLGDATAFNQALCGLYAAGFGVDEVERVSVSEPSPVAERRPPQPRRRAASLTRHRPPSPSSSPAPPSGCPVRRACSTTPTSLASCTASRGSTSSRRGSATRSWTSTSPAW